MQAESPRVQSEFAQAGAGKCATSVVIPVHNGAATINQTLDSVLAQTVKPLEIVVVDDGSTDSTAQLLEEYGDRIAVLRQPNRGPSNARNAGAAAVSTRSKYLLFLDADDALTPEMLGKLSTALESAPPAVLAYCDAALTDVSGTRLGANFIRSDRTHAPSMDELLKKWWPILPSAALLRRDAFMLSGGFAEDFQPNRATAHGPATAQGHEDVFLWLRMREQGEFRYVPEPLILYRVLPATGRISKYASGFATFKRLVLARYGPAAQPLIRSCARFFASAWGRAGLDALARGDKREARRAFVMAIRYRPDGLHRWLRLLRTFLPLWLARSLSAKRAPSRLG